MARRLAANGLRLLPVLLGVTLMAGCGGDAGVSVTQPPPPPPSGPAVTGTVLMPNGQLAMLDPSLFERVARVASNAAEALTLMNAAPVGRNVQVVLEQLGGNPLQTVFTNDQGQFRFDLDPGVTDGACPPLIVAVGAGSTLTRALVYPTGGSTDSIDIDCFSEAALRIILQNSVPLCNAGNSANSSAISSIVQAVRNAPGTITGLNTADANTKATAAAMSSPQVQAAVAAALGTVTPVATTPAATPTNTATPIVFSPTPKGTSTNTITPRPSNTPTSTSTIGNTPTITKTKLPTITPQPPTLTPTTVATTPANTPTASSTATQTNTQIPTSTPSATSTSTQTQITTFTTTPVTPPSATSTPTETPVSATNTPTDTPVVVPTTNTPTDTPTVVSATNTPTATDTETPGVTATFTSTPTGPPPSATSTPSNTAINTPTSTATNTVPVPTATPTNTVPPPTSTPTNTTAPTQGAVAVRIAPGGGTAGNCRGTCQGGSRMGLSCGLASDCPGSTCGGSMKCVGGPLDGTTCTQAANCNGCKQNPPKGSCAIIQLTFAITVPLNGVCVPRSFPPGDIPCTSDAECRICVGGSNAGQICAADDNCTGGACSGAGTCRLDALSFTMGTPDANGEAKIDIPQESLLLNPAIVPNIGAVCVLAGGDGVGVIDCNGGRSGINVTISRDHNTTPNKTCILATNNGAACTKNSDCTGTGAKCNLGNGLSGPAPTPGLPNDPTCTAKFIQPDGTFSFACLEGTKQCAGGTNDGTLCTSGTDCTGGGGCGFCNIGNNGGSTPGLCNSPAQAVLSGTFGAGDMAIALPLAISVLSAPSAPPPVDWGPDGLPCTDDDSQRPPGTPTPVPLPGVSVALSTGTNSMFVYDANNTAGLILGPGSKCTGVPCIAQVVGKKTSCDNVMAGNVSGIQIGGGFPALEAALGTQDIVTNFQFVFETLPQ